MSASRSLFAGSREAKAMACLIMMACLPLGGCQRDRDPKTSELDVLVTENDARLASRDAEATIPVTIHVGGGQSLQGSFAITSKGNGCIEIAQLRVRAYDAHHDERVHEPPLLRVVQGHDAHGMPNGFVVTGIERVSLDGNEGATFTRPIHVRYVYDTVENRFDVIGDEHGITLQR